MIERKNYLFTVKTLEDLEKCFNLMKELRPDLDYSNFVSIYEHSHKNDGYEIVAIESDGNILALMGYRFLYDYVRGKHIYIDDLVTSQLARSQGLGSELLIYAEKIARENDCKVLRLCTGIDNLRGAQFYEKNGWSKSAFAYTKKI